MERCTVIYTLKITSKIGSNNFTQFQKISDNQRHNFPPKKLLAMFTLFPLEFSVFAEIDTHTDIISENWPNSC